MPNKHLSLWAARWLDGDDPVLLVRKLDGPYGLRVVVDVMDKRRAEATVYHMRDNNELGAKGARIIEGKRMWQLIEMLGSHRA